GRIVCCVLLSKIVYKLRFGTHPKREAYGGDISQDGKLATRFSETEIETLWQRFSELDQAIQSEGEQFVPGFQSGPMKYNFNDMPPNFGLSEFMASWA
ncbi:MAG: hypothetical protein HOH43_13330, partial [Candidatus Latescibacteria bacterium]|nr:hypothetical protein [Candidatus Latescibacterota bacterium]